MIEPLFQIKPLEWKIVNENKCEAMTLVGYFSIEIIKQKVWWTCSRETGEHNAASVEEAKLDAWHLYRNLVEKLLIPVRSEALVPQLTWTVADEHGDIRGHGKLATYLLDTVRKRLYMDSGDTLQVISYPSVEQAKREAQLHYEDLVTSLLVGVRKA